MRIEEVNEGDSVQNALTRLEKEGGLLKLAPGRFTVGERLRYESDKPLSIMGAGSGLTRLFFSGSAGGLSVSVDDDFETGGMTVEGIGIHPSKNYDTPGFSFTSVNQRGGPKPGSHVRDVVVATEPGRHRRSAAFESGIQIHNLPYVRMDGCYAYGGGVGAAYRLTGDSTPGPVLTGCRGYNWDAAFTKRSSSDDITEGTRLVACNFVNNNYGVHWDNRGSNGEPGLQVLGGHIASVIANIRGWRSHQIRVANVLFYMRGNAVDDFADVDLSGCISANVMGNISSGPGDAKGETAILRTTRCREVICEHNVLQGNARKYEWLNL